MSNDLRRTAAHRANYRCEYCKLPDHATKSVPFHVDHIRARQHGGGETLDNICYSCWRCNLYKGPNQSAYDPDTNGLVRLFHPREDSWNEHFRLAESWIDGLTAIGRATVALLRMNDELRIELRQTLLDEISPTD